MHKKLEAELIHLAHQILKFNNLTDINELRDKARAIYENLSVLSFIDEYFIETPEVTDSKEDFIEELTNLSSKKVVNKKVVKEETIVPKTEETKDPEKTKTFDALAPNRKANVESVEVKEEETEQLIEQTVKTIKTEAKEIVSKIQKTPKEELVVEENSTLAEEMKHSIPADVAADMFEKAETIVPKTEETKDPEKTKTFDALTPNRKAEVESVEVETNAPEKTKTFDALAPSRKAEVESETVVEKIIKTLEKVEQDIPAKKEKPKVNIATKQEVPTPKPASTPTPTSLNDRISNQKIQVGLNDRIAFVKHLFNFSQEDFNRILSQLNTLTSESECKDFIENNVKPDYNWEGKEEYEARLIALVEKKFK